MSESKALIAGCSGLALTADETAFFRDERPWAFILFARNVGDAGQLTDLVSALRDTVGRADAPVYGGCEGPIRRRLVTATHVHGESGLDGPDLPVPKAKLQEKHGVDYLVDTFRAAEPGEITLCTLGPLTNVAMALIKAPDIAPRIREIASTRLLDRARILGAVMRVAYVASASMPGVLPRSPLMVEKGVLKLKLSGDLAALASGRLNNRVRQLGKLIGRDYKIEIA